MSKIAVIGAGVMGNGIAHIFAQYGFETILIDRSEEALKKAADAISKNLDRQVKKQSITEEDKQNTLNNITLHTSFDIKLKGCILVVEAATENKAVKLEIFKTLDAICDAETILASNTSSISITEIANATKRADKIIGMHFMNPVPMMPLVEIINGYSTSKMTTEFVINISKKLDKIPIAAHDYPGFVANRILMPMLNEAMYALHEGVAGVAEIDGIMKLGMGHPMGPLQLADFIGLDTCLSILNVLYDGFKLPKYAPCPLLINMVNAGNLGKKTQIGFYDYKTESKTLIVAPTFIK